MKELETTYESFLDLRSFQKKYWPGWHAVFSTNCRGEKWSCTTKGWTPINQRNDLSKVQLLEMLAAEYGNVRNERGRIFINYDGAFFKIEEMKFEQFVRFKFLPGSPS